jgi:hypothetical protein
MEDIMQKLVKAFENIMVAVTFAEAGEYDEARKISGHEHEEEAATIPVTTDMRAAKKAS